MDWVLYMEVSIVSLVVGVGIASWGAAATKAAWAWLGYILMLASLVAIVIPIFSGDVHS